MGDGRGSASPSTRRRPTGSGCVCYGCATPDGVERTLFLRDGEADRDRLEVEGTLRVLHHPAAVHGGMAFTAFTEYRVVDAERQ